MQTITSLETVSLDRAGTQAPPAPTAKIPSLNCEASTGSRPHESVRQTDRLEVNPDKNSIFGNVW
jgi:hypothetical protein